MVRASCPMTLQARHEERDDAGGRDRRRPVAAKFRAARDFGADRGNFGQGIVQVGHGTTLEITSNSM